MPAASEVKMNGSEKNGIGTQAAKFLVSKYSNSSIKIMCN